MAEHKIDGNDGAGNVQAPERIWMFAETMKPYISGGGKIMMGDIEYIRAVVAASQLAAANARADAAWDALRNIAELNKTARDENGHAWDNSDLIAQEIHFALRDKPAPTVTVHGWQPIETAPKDGSPFLGCDADYIFVAIWDRGNRVHLTDTGQGFCYPTHWMPLPALPEA